MDWTELQEGPSATQATVCAWAATAAAATVLFRCQTTAPGRLCGSILYKLARTPPAHGAFRTGLRQPVPSAALGSTGMYQSPGLAVDASKATGGGVTGHGQAAFTCRGVQAAQEGRGSTSVPWVCAQVCAKDTFRWSGSGEGNSEPLAT
jgi:hypothetical protein